MPRFVLAPAHAPDPVPRRRFLARTLSLLAGGALLGRAQPARAAGNATQGDTPFIGEISIVAFTFAPRGWAFCNGQILSIAQNTALFSLIGTTYGGDGQTTFALPNLQSRVPIHAGQGPGLSLYDLGQTGGEENHVLLVTELPAHNHPLKGDSANGVSDTPTGRLPARNPAGIPQYGANASVDLSANAIAATGGSQPHNNIPPYLTLNFIIALEGIFPSRP